MADMSRDTIHEITSALMMFTITVLLIINVRHRDAQITQLKQQLAKQQLSATVKCKSDVLIIQP